LRAHATVLNSNLPIHDPSRMVKDGSAWWIFATGTGIDVKLSPDKVHWYQRPQVFTNSQDPYWAPDMWNGRIHGQFYLFYSQPTAPFGTKGARIGVAVTKSLAKPAWTDLGTIIATSDDTDFNTIDPAPYYELDPANPEVMISTPTRIAGGNGFGIEASYPLYRNGWFYLFANWDLCCRGGLSNYKIVVGRSRSITGPYVDKDGIDMQNGGGSMFMAGAGVEIGPGHFGETHIEDGTNEVFNAFTYHAYVPQSPRQGQPGSPSGKLSGRVMTGRVPTSLRRFNPVTTGSASSSTISTLQCATNPRIR
jgi:arabinan endo-1,5-alpha-L-arabinosidase